MYNRKPFLSIDPTSPPCHFLDIMGSPNHVGSNHLKLNWNLPNLIKH